MASEPCECCNGYIATHKAKDGAPVCARCFNSGCDYAVVSCDLADIEQQIADGAEYLYAPTDHDNAKKLAAT